MRFGLREASQRFSKAMKAVRALTRFRQPATKNWADSYLAAFATVGQLTLVTFDRGLRSKAKSAVLLGNQPAIESDRSRHAAILF